MQELARYTWFLVYYILISCEAAEPVSRVKTEVVCTVVIGMRVSPGKMFPAQISLEMRISPYTCH